MSSLVSNGIGIDPLRFLSSVVVTPLLFSYVSDLAFLCIVF